MKTLLLLTLLAPAALAQIPAHSVVGNVTVDVADVTIPVAYGVGTETKAALSVCSNLDSSYAFMSVAYIGDPMTLQVSVKLTKTDTAYCGVFLASASQKKIASLEVTEVRVTTVSAPPLPPPAVQASSPKVRQ